MKHLTEVDVAPLIDWLSQIDYADWPQQDRLADGQIRPAMVSDPNWHGFAEAIELTVRYCLRRFPSCVAAEPMLSVVMPGHDIPAHTDNQNERWVTRLHLPLMTNPEALFIVDGEPHHLEVGKAYQVDTRRMHAVSNLGTTPRVHFMFDVVRAAYDPGMVLPL